MKNMNLILVIFLSVVLAFVVWNRLHQIVKPTPPPTIDDTIVIPDKEPEKVEETPEDIKSDPLEDATSYSEALKLAKEHKRPIFLFFGAHWCHWCVQMTNGALKDTEVKNKLAMEYVVYYVDTDKVKNITRKFKVSGIPVSIIIDADENIISRCPGTMSKQDLLQFLDQKAKTTSLIEINSIDE